MKITKLYLDMDGVIANFNKKYKEFFDMEPPEADKKKMFQKQFDEFIARNGFADLDLMPGAAHSLAYLKSLSIPTEILSSTSDEKRHSEISKQKESWLRKHNVNFPTIFVPGKRLKQNYANPNVLLIDDTESVIKQFKAAGGKAIHHHDWVITLSTLKMYVH
jgi:hypothetical protein